MKCSFLTVKDKKQMITFNSCANYMPMFSNAFTHVHTLMDRGRGMRVGMCIQSTSQGC